MPRSDMPFFITLKLMVMTPACIVSDGKLDWCNDLPSQLLRKRKSRRLPGRNADLQQRT